MRRKDVRMLAWALFLTFSLVGIGSGQATSPQEVSGTLKVNTRWNKDVRVVGDVIVPKGVTLTIDPGVTVTFANQSGCPPWQLIIKEEGTLNAQGTAAKKITFTSQNRRPGDWRGIVLQRGAKVTGKVLSHLVIEYADEGLAVHCNDITIEDCTIHDCYGVKTADNPKHYDVRTGLLVHGNDVTVKNCTITNCTWGIHIDGSTDVTVDHCTIKDNNKTCEGRDSDGKPFDVPNGIHICKSTGVTCKDSTIGDNTWGIEIGNSEVTITTNTFQVKKGDYGIVLGVPDGVSTGTVVVDKKKEFSGGGVLCAVAVTWGTKLVPVDCSKLLAYSAAVRGSFTLQKGAATQIVYSYHGSGSRNVEILAVSESKSGTVKWQKGVGSTWGKEKELFRCPGQGVFSTALANNGKAQLKASGTATAVEGTVIVYIPAQPSRATSQQSKNWSVSAAKRSFQVVDKAGTYTLIVKNEGPGTVNVKIDGEIAGGIKPNCMRIFDAVSCEKIEIEWVFGDSAKGTCILR